MDLFLNILTYVLLALSLVSLAIYIIEMAKRPDGYGRKPLEIIFLILTALFSIGFLISAFTSDYTIYLMVAFGGSAIIITLTTFIIVKRRY